MAHQNCQASYPSDIYKIDDFKSSKKVKQFQINGQKQILKSNYRKVNFTKAVTYCGLPHAMPTIHTVTDLWVPEKEPPPPNNKDQQTKLCATSKQQF